MRRAGIVGMILFTAVLAGCGGQSYDSTKPNYHESTPQKRTTSLNVKEQKVDLNDGRVVNCLVSDQYGYAALSCDWSNASRG